MGKSQVLTRAWRVTYVVTHERAEQRLLPYAFLRSEAGLGECLSRSAFPRASLRLLCLCSPNKGRVISSSYRGASLWGFGQELVYVRQTRSGGDAGWASLRASAWLYPGALESTGRNQQLHMPPAWSLSPGALPVQCLIFIFFFLLSKIKP